MAKRRVLCYTNLMSLRRIHRTLKVLTLTLATATLVTLGYARLTSDSLTGVIIRRPQQTTGWKFIDQAQVSAGASVSPDTHVVFHLPLSMDRITLDVLFGQRSFSTRFWGYCLPPNYDPKLQEDRSNLPGLMFLSKKERIIREEEAKIPTQASFSLFRLPSKSDLQEGSRARGRIRHELDVFEPGMLCYVMTEQALAIGTDADKDTLNSRLEQDLGTLPNLPDSDSDGIADGVEYRTETNPTMRDTDTDGLPDGIEDANWNGQIDTGETDPRTKDSDRDGLCDGLCLIDLRGGIRLYIGEDRNLNGKVDTKETSPLLWDTNGNGSSDYQEWITCYLDGKKDC